MVWVQPQLTDPPMGPTDEIRRLQHRLLFAYPTFSQSHELGVRETGIFDTATDAALRNIQAHIGGKVNSQPGVLTYDTKIALGVVVVAPVPPSKRFVQQGVGYPAMGFLQPDPTVSYNESRAMGVAELLRLALPDPRPKVVIGYSQGEDVANNAMEQWPADRRDEIRLYVGFGSPSRTPGATLLGNDPGGAGISNNYTATWLQGRAFHFTHDGDMYANARGLLPFFYDILTRMDVSLEFAVYLFTALPTQLGQILLGQTPSADPLSGVLAPILGLITPGPRTSTTGPIINPLGIFAVLPELVYLMVDGIKFLSTQAHFRYHDQPESFWRGLTGVDCAAQIIAERVREPGPVVVYTVPGTWAGWNDGPPAWTAWKLP